MVHTVLNMCQAVPVGSLLTETLLFGARVRVRVMVLCRKRYAVT